jgi:hypothetical protein
VTAVVDRLTLWQRWVIIRGDLSVCEKSKQVQDLKAWAGVVPGLTRQYTGRPDGRR